MSWTTFRWDHPNFKVRSILDGDTFEVERECLIAGSEVFRDMFSFCEPGYVRVMSNMDEDGEILEVNESSSSLNMLFHLLHYPPEPYDTTLNKAKDFTRIEETIPESTIPFPILPMLFTLADKYVFSERIMQTIQSHLEAYAPSYPLRVYGLAVELGLSKVAAKASMHLLHPPLSSYTTDQIKAIPTAEAYHRLVLLHGFRIKTLTEILAKEQIFPERYGWCARHGDKTVVTWEARKKAVSADIEAATDVAAEMSVIQHELPDCGKCSRASTAAVAMLGYKCGKVPKRVDKLPE